MNRFYRGEQLMNVIRTVATLSTITNIKIIYLFFFSLRKKRHIAVALSDGESWCPSDNYCVSHNFAILYIDGLKNNN